MITLILEYQELFIKEIYVIQKLYLLKEYVPTFSLKHFI